MDTQTPGEIAYEAYCVAVGGVSVRGERLPTYAEQQPRIRDAWDAAAAAVVEHVTSHTTG